jgi:NTE family protein
VSGEYVQFHKDYPHLSQAVLASTALPLVWEPVDLSSEYQAMVDGGLRNITPIGDVLDANPDEIVIINCSPRAPDQLPCPPRNAFEIGLRSIDLMTNEIFQNDQREFLRINALVKEAAEYGVILHHPRSGKAYKAFRCQIIEPESPLGDTMDFSQEAIQHSLRMGVKRAREVLGR